MERLARLLPEGGFDWYVAITRGGLVPACLLAQITGQTCIDTICAHSYGDGRVQGEVRVLGRDYGHLKGQRVLLIDDLCDSGATMKAAIHALGRFDPVCVQTAAVFVKSCSTFKPDYYIEARPADRWIVFPWEADQCLTGM